MLDWSNHLCQGIPVAKTSRETKKERRHATQTQDFSDRPARIAHVVIRGGIADGVGICNP